MMYPKIKNKLKAAVHAFKNKQSAKGKTKIFCIGRNKTGTTSLKKAFEDLGHPVGNQRKAELLTAEHYFENEFQEILNYCTSAQVFQDIPFSYPETYKHLDKAYPNSKFILTIRDNEEQWYKSITRYHGKMFGKNGDIPTYSDLQKATYIKDGYMANVTKVHGTPENDPYNKEIMISHYLNYNQEIIEYFKNRPDDLLIINIADKGAYSKFTEFLGIKSNQKDFPWENKT
ncbi:hypothetical protein H5085_05760 [Pseudoalteromonas sp. SR43-6]|nr:hypothetical protein [Pseudoalteromonas sp. SR41-5]MBB1373823.1 hypothetical protein [Pseudoalteromonas sp. SR43-6]MBB1412874.1 hypothetical protein [Pseudoalteromonas sp. SG43-8]